jgi:hypothetical protein
MCSHIGNAHTVEAIKKLADNITPVPGPDGKLVQRSGTLTHGGMVFTFKLCDDCLAAIAAFLPMMAVAPNRRSFKN